MPWPPPSRCSRGSRCSGGGRSWTASTCVWVGRCIYMHTHVHIDMHMCTCICICIYICMCMCKCMSACGGWSVHLAQRRL